LTVTASYRGGVHSTWADGRDTEGRGGALAVVLVAGLLVVDVVIGRELGRFYEPAVVAGVGAIVAVYGARTYLLGWTLLAVAGSCAVSLVVGSRPGEGYSFVMPGLAELGGLGFLMAWSIRSLRVVPAAVATSAVAIAVGAIAFIRPDGSEGPAAATIVVDVLLAVGYVAALAAGLYLRSIDRGQIERATRVREEERLSIARDLHDLVAHHVTGIVVQAQAANLVSGTNPDAATDALQAIEHAGAQALVAMRAMVGELRSEDGDAPLSPAATLDDLRAIAQRCAAQGLEVHVRDNGALEGTSPDLAVSVHRIVREAITNTQRHARGATAVDVWIDHRGDHLDVVVTDDGQGAVAARAGSGFGLIGMAERAAALGGHFSAGPTADGGWEVRAQLPDAGALH
jgi:signal transduction histidine kinase